MKTKASISPPIRIREIRSSDRLIPAETYGKAHGRNGFRFIAFGCIKKTLLYRAHIEAGDDSGRRDSLTAFCNLSEICVAVPERVPDLNEWHPRRLRQGTPLRRSSNAKRCVAMSPSYPPFRRRLSSARRNSSCASQINRSTRAWGLGSPLARSAAMVSGPLSTLTRQSPEARR